MTRENGVCALIVFHHHLPVSPSLTCSHLLPWLWTLLRPHQYSDTVTEVYSKKCLGTLLPQPTHQLSTVKLFFDSHSRRLFYTSQRPLTMIPPSETQLITMKILKEQFEMQQTSLSLKYSRVSCHLHTFCYFTQKCTSFYKTLKHYSRT